MGKPVTREDVERVVANNDKKRFTIEGDRIRAAQGHSTQVDLGLKPQEAVPTELFHGTVADALPDIRENGLKPMSRQYVHLSKDVVTAETVGSRRGAPIILKVRAKDMQAAGIPLYLADNGVWLAESVPPQYIEFPEPLPPLNAWLAKANSDKRVIIMRGLPGSGKSTKARTYGGTIVSADDFFMQDGQYVFDPKKLPEAHATSLRLFEEALKRGDPVVVVDNTNTTAWEYQKYVDKAEQNGYAVEYDVVGSGGVGIDELVKRNTHGVPEQAIKRMVDRWEGDKLYPDPNDPLPPTTAKLKPAVSAEALAKKWKVSVEVVNKALDKGQKVEREHTSSDAEARQIASHHIEEDLNYYDKLEVMEKKASLDTAKAKEIKAKLSTVAQKNGYKVYAVGGYVRDLLLGRTPKDLDCVAVKDEDGVNAGINFATLVAKEYGLRPPVTFPRFGTAKLEIDGEEVEFVAPRKETYTEGSRKPEVERGTLEDDARRRDFTVNALYQDVGTDEVLDPTGHGQQDIKDKIIRVADVENPEIIFTEDPLRSLRAIRQSYSLGFTIEEGTMAALKKTAERLPNISQERIRDEFLKILKTPKASDAIRMLRDTGLMHQFLPEWSELYTPEGEDRTHGTSPYHKETIPSHILKTVDLSEANEEDRLVALLHDIAKPRRERINDKGHTAFHGHEDESAEMAQKILERLKMPGEAIQRIVFRIKNHMRPHSYDDKWTAKTINKFVKDMGDALPKILEFARYDILSAERDQEITDKELAKADQLEKEVKQRQESGVTDILRGKPLLSGEELKSMFNKNPGPWIGELHKHLADLQETNPAMTKEEAIAKAQEYMEAKDAKQVPPEDGKEATSSLHSEACECGCGHNKQLPRSIVVGACGFNHPSWEGTFYPKALKESEKLLYFASHIPAVEINCTQHLIPRRDVFERWAAQTPKEFTFCFRVIADRKVADTIDLLFTRALATIGHERMGPISVVIPKGRPYTYGDVDKFYCSVPAHPYAFDLQSEAWVCAEAYDEIMKCHGTIVRNHLLGGKIEGMFEYIRIPLYAAMREADLGNRIKVFAMEHVLDPGNVTEKFVMLVDEDSPTQNAANTVLETLKHLKKKYTPSPVDISILPKQFGGPSDPQTGPNNSALPGGTPSVGERNNGPMDERQPEAVNIKRRKILKPGDETLTPETTYPANDNGGMTEPAPKVDSGY